jgi:hypothetical protein
VTHASTTTSSHSSSISSTRHALYAGSEALRLLLLFLLTLCLLSDPNLLPAAAGEVLAEVRREFALQRGKAAPYDIKYALSDGRNKLKLLEEAIGFSR